MRWLLVFCALSFAPACTTEKPEESEAAEAKAKKAPEKSKKPSDKSGASSKRSGDKASASSKKGSEGKQGKAGAEKKPQPTYGAKGEVVGDLTLKETQEGEKTKTAASLSLVSGEKEETVKLGGIAGTCEMVEPAKLDEGTALWTVDCDTAGGEASVSIAQQGDALVVAKAPKGGEYKPLRKIKLVEGAVVVAKAAAK